MGVQPTDVPLIQAAKNVVPEAVTEGKRIWACYQSNVVAPSLTCHDSR